MAGNECYLLFSAGGRTYAIAGSRVSEIVRQEDVTAVPLVDFNLLLSGYATMPGPRACVVIVTLTRGSEEERVGLLIDEAVDVAEFDGAELGVLPDFGPRVRLPYLAGLVRRDGGFVIILDVDQLMPSEERQAS